MHVRTSAIALVVIASLSLGACAQKTDQSSEAQGKKTEQQKAKKKEGKKAEKKTDKKTAKKGEKKPAPAPLFTSDTQVVCCLSAGEQCSEVTFSNCGGGFILPADGAVEKCTEKCAAGELAPANR